VSATNNGGRPKTLPPGAVSGPGGGNPEVKFRLDRATWTRLENRAEDQGMKASEYVRALLLQAMKEQAGL
jgi:hypothetical protein